jgi:hypothetical protein
MGANLKAGFPEKREFCLLPCGISSIKKENQSVLMMILALF